MQVLLIDRYASATDPLAQGLAADRLVLDFARTPAEARAMVSTRDYDVIVIDLSQSHRASDTILTDRAARRHIPLIALVPKTALTGATRSLHHLADDWMHKPVAMMELVARIRAVHARSTHNISKTFRLEALALNPGAQQAWFNEIPLRLTRREFAALATLIRYPGHVVPRRMLEVATYGEDAEVSANAIEATLSRLRRSLRAAGCLAKIETIRGIGWRLVPLSLQGSGA